MKSECSSGKKTTIYDDYEHVFQKYRALYGPQLVVAYEVGSFYEWYNSSAQEGAYELGCDVIGVCELLNVQYTRRSKAVQEISSSNPLLGGVPKSSFPKYLPVLLENEYTVVIVSQLGSAPNFTRRVTDVISKGTCLDGSVSFAGEGGASSSSIATVSASQQGGGGTFLMALFLDFHKKSRRQNHLNGVFSRSSPSSSVVANDSVVVLHAGCALVDVNTGHTCAFEVSSSEDDVSAALDDMHRIVHEYAPLEVVLYGRPEALGAAASETGGRVGNANDDGGSDIQADHQTRETHLRRFLTRLVLNPRTVRDRLDDDEAKRLSSVKFQEHVLAKVFPAPSFLTAIERLDLEHRPHAAAALVGVLEFVHEHDETLVRNLLMPEVATCGESGDEDGEKDGDEDGKDETKERPRLRLDYNSAEQLDLADRGGGASSKTTLCGILNKCVTSMGRRYFRHQLLHPLVRKREIEARLDDVEALLAPAPCSSCPSTCSEDEAERGGAERKAKETVERRFVDVRKRLDKVVDLERIFRRFSVGRVEPRHMVPLDASLVELASLPTTMYSSSSSASAQPRGSGLAETCRDLALRLRSSYDAIFDIAEGCSDFVTSRVNVFRDGVFPDLDALQNAATTSRRRVDKLVDALNASQGQGNFRVEMVTLGPGDGSGGSTGQGSHNSTSAALSAKMAVVATPKRCATLKRVSGGPNKVLWHGTADEFRFRDLEIRTVNKTTSALQHPELDAWCRETVTAEERLRELVATKFAEETARLWDREKDAMRELADAVSRLDFASTCALNAQRWRHKRPVISSTSHSMKPAFVSARALRHPLLDAFQDKVPQVPNDIEVGTVYDEEKGGEKRERERERAGGVLLYGMNAAGKSCLMKAVALSVVMAQAGMFAPSAEFEISPFRRIFTRIQSRDDIARGQSTFMCEMAELRNILRRCDARSLVIGDEVCSGTESVSAISIVGATLLRLLTRRVPFVFATHLHELPGLTELRPFIDVALHEGGEKGGCKQTDGGCDGTGGNRGSGDDGGSARWRLRVCHLKVRHDPGTGRLVYDRKLCDGQGPTVYGLEVCKALDMEADFVDAAHAIRRALLGVPNRLGTDSRCSRYNAKVVMDVCGLCRVNKADEVHHIRHQVEADAEGYVDYFHKNVAYNLVPLCSACHDAVHAGKIQIKGFLQTSNGIALESGSYSECRNGFVR